MRLRRGLGCAPAAAAVMWSSLHPAAGLLLALCPMQMPCHANQICIISEVPAAASSNTWQQHRADLWFARQMMPVNRYSYRQSRHLPKNCCICSRAAAAISAMPAGWWLLLLGGRPSTPPPAFGLRKPPELLRRLLLPLALLLPTPTSPRALRTPAMAAGRAERWQLGWACAGHSWLPQLQCARSHINRHEGPCQVRCEMHSSVSLQRQRQASSSCCSDRTAMAAFCRSRRCAESS